MKSFAVFSQKTWCNFTPTQGAYGVVLIKIMSLRLHNVEGTEQKLFAEEVLSLNYKKLLNILQNDINEWKL